MGLEEAGVDIILVGGLAAVIRGAPITTMDVDIVHDQWQEQSDIYFMATSFNWDGRQIFYQKSEIATGLQGKRGRNVTKGDERYHLREKAAHYMVLFRLEKHDIGL